MPETEKEKINKARYLISQGDSLEARKILESIYTSQDPNVRLDVVLSFLVVLDHVTENDKLIEVADMGIKIARQIGKNDILGYLLAKKSIFLFAHLSALIHRQKNLILSANVFKWIGFALERDKKEFEFIVEKRKGLENEIDELITIVIEQAEHNTEHYSRGHLFSAVGDFYSSKYLIDKLDFIHGGKIRSKIANMYFVRRWSLDNFLYTKDNQRKINESRKKCILYFERSIDEFRLGEKKSEEAYMIYTLAVKQNLFYCFGKAKKLVAQAKDIATLLNEKLLLDKIVLLEKENANKNRNIRNYVEEFGLDLP